MTSSNIRILACRMAVAGCLIVLGAWHSTVHAQTPCAISPPVSIPPPNVSTSSASLVSIDACIPQSVPGGNPIAYFDDYSWRTFVALVWPALSGQRGTPDPNQGIDATHVPLVFETYKADWETFQPGGAAPSDWNSITVAVSPCPGARPGDFILGSFTKFGNVGEAGMPDLVSVLVAQNGTFVRYLAAYNQAEFDRVRNSKLYLSENLPQNMKPPGAPITFQAGALDVKSSWIDMSGVPHPERYHTRNAWLLDPISGKCAAGSTVVGLVGLHIVQKTPSRPQWIWSSFEQIDNVPPPNYVPPTPPTRPTQFFTFNDGTGNPMPAVAPAPYIWQNAMTAGSVPPPLNVTRLTPINNSTSVSRNTVATNSIWQQALRDKNSVWQFYQLTMTQWPTTPNSPKDPGTPNNTFPGQKDHTSAFANTTLETWDQTQIRQGCMSCHNLTQSDDFLWSLEVNAFKKPASGLSATLLTAQKKKNPLSSQIKALRALLQAAPH